MPDGQTLPLFLAAALALGLAGIRAAVPAGLRTIFRRGAVTNVLIGLGLRLAVGGRR